MGMQELFTTVRDSLTTERVFGNPQEIRGQTVIPVAAILGGAGGGSGTDPKGQQGEGGGFGVHARPVGVFVFREGRVSWRPAIDVSRLITVAGIVAIVYFFRRPRSRHLQS